jgi:hypothetical protein
MKVSACNLNNAGTISGASTFNTNTTSTFVSTIPGGKWRSLDTIIATVNSITGVVTGRHAGSTSIVYEVSTNSSCFTAYASKEITITCGLSNPTVGAISGVSSLSEGSITLSNATLGGTWWFRNHTTDTFHYAYPPDDYFTNRYINFPPQYVKIYNTTNNTITFKFPANLCDFVYKSDNECGSYVSPVKTIKSTTNISIANVVQPNNCINPNGQIVISGLLDSSWYTLRYKITTSNNVYVVNQPIYSSSIGTDTLKNLGAATFSDFSIVSSYDSATYSNGNIIDNYKDTLVSNIITAPIVLSLPNTNINANVNSQPSDCNTNNGSIIITGIPTNQLFTYRVFPHNGSIISSALLASNSSGTSLVQNLSVGVYDSIVITTVNNGCKSNATGSVQLTGSPQISSVSVTNTCSNIGMINLSGLSANTSYTITYRKDGVFQTPITQNSNSTGILIMSNLVPAVYDSIRVQKIGCSVYSSAASATVQLLSNVVPTISSTVSQPTVCSYNNGSITISGLTANSSYQLNYSKNNIAQPAATITASTSGIYMMSALSAGTYDNIYVVKTGCSSNVLGPILLSLPQAPLVSVVSTGNPSTCAANNGYIKLSGLYPSSNFVYTYKKNGASAISSGALVADASGNYTISGLGAGIYDSILIKPNSNLCISLPVGPVSLTGTPVISSAVGTNPTSCTGTNGFIKLSGLLVNSNYILSYQLNGVSQASQNVIATNLGVININNLTGGTYSNISVIPVGCTDNSNVVGPITLTSNVATTFPMITTIIGGNQASSNADGIIASDAILSFPGSIAKDALGNIYIADEGNINNPWKIRKVDNQGHISSIYNVSSGGFSQGDGSLLNSGVYFTSLGDMTFDGSGNMYIVDGGQSIRKVNISGITNTIAGSNNSNPGFSGDGGPATSAAFNNIYGIATDKYGNLYVADHNNNRIRKINVVSGVVNTIAGNGTATYSGDGGPAINASLNLPTGIVVDTNMNIYIIDAGNHRIRKVNPSGTITTIAGNGIDGYSGDGGSAINASLHSPWQITIDTLGNIYFVESHIIRKIGTNGIISKIAGTGISPSDALCTGDGGQSTAAGVSYPTDLIVDNKGNLLFTETGGNSRVRKVSSQTGLYITVSTDVNIMNGTPVTFTASSNTSSSATYIWKKNGIAIPGQVGVTYTTNNIANNDTISCVMTVPNCPTGILNYYSNAIIMHILNPKKNMLQTTAVNPLAEHDDIKLYPNPTKSILFVDSKEPLNINVTDLAGKLLCGMKMDKYIDLSQLGSGMYIVYLYNMDGILLHVERVIKE